MQKIKVWDIPTRLCHWLLVLAVALLFATGIEGGGWMECHARLGLVVVGLLAFRLAWGVIGSTYARFTQFFPTPAAIRAYLQGNWRGLGHNPLGAFSVFALLLLTLAQTLTGLVANDEISFYGPLYKLVDSSLSIKLTGLHHELAWYGLAVFVGLHVASIVFYKLVKKNDLVTPMLTGKKEVAESDKDKAYKGGGIIAFLVALAFALLAVWGASGEWIPKPPPPAVIETPSW